MQSPERTQPAAQWRAASLPSPAAQNVDDAADDADRIVACRGFQPGGAGDRASLDAFAATGAGVDHGVDAALQGGLEGLGHGGLPSILQKNDTAYEGYQLAGGATPSPRRGEGWGEGARIYEKNFSIRAPSPSLASLARPLPSGER